MEDWKDQGVLFRRSSTWEYKDKINHYYDNKPIVHYRIDIDGTLYYIPHFVVVEVSKVPMNSSTENKSTAQQWQDKVTEDEYVKQTGNRDIRQARLDIDGQVIGAKKRQEQTDYKDELYWDAYGI